MEWEKIRFPPPGQNTVDSPLLLLAFSAAAVFSMVCTNIYATLTGGHATITKGQGKVTCNSYAREKKNNRNNYNSIFSRVSRFPDFDDAIRAGNYHCITVLPIAPIVAFFSKISSLSKGRESCHSVRIKVIRMTDSLAS